MNLKKKMTQFLLGDPVESSSIMIYVAAEQKVVPGIEDYHKMPVLCILTCDFYCFMIAMWCHYTAFTHITGQLIITDL